MDQELIDILNSYDYLVPPRDEGAVIILLNRKIENKEIDRNFTYQDFQQTIFELSQREGHQPQTERILRNLLHYFIERPPEKKDRYKLTEYSLSFLKLIQNKLTNPYRSFPLRESFKQYALFKAQDIKNIIHFQAWYEQGFNTTTRQTIIDHLEALRDEVEHSIRKLNAVLYSTDSETLTTVNEFGVAFKSFGEKAEEIRDALRLGINLEQEIGKVVNFFYQRIEQSKHPESREEMQTHEIAENDYFLSSGIQRKVIDFFQLVDEKLAQVKDRILFSSTKLTELQDNFKYQTTFKINIKRFLTYTLEQGTYSKEGPTLPPSFPKKVIPYGFSKFIVVPYYEFLSSVQNKVITPSRNDKYRKKEKEKIELELQRQENTVKWVKKYKQLLATNRKLDFTPHFYSIWEAEQDIEVPLHVAFELFQFANKSEYQIKIDKVILKEFSKQSVITWKMKISLKD